MDFKQWSFGMNCAKFKETVPDEIKGLRKERAAKIAEFHKIQDQIDELSIKEMESLKGYWVAAPCPSSNNLTTVVRIVDVTHPRKCKQDGRIKMMAQICLRLDFARKGVFVYPKSKKFELINGSYRIMSVPDLMGIVEEYKNDNPRLVPEFEKAMAQF